MLVEMHAHTSRHSACSRLDPVSLVRLVLKKGLQGLVITEHDYLWSPSAIEGLKREAQADESFLLLTAQEVSTDIGHVLVFGPDHTITGVSSVKDLRKRYPGAALVWAHPLRSGREPERAKLLNPDLDAIEIFNNNHSTRGNYLGLMLWHRDKFIAVSGSDTHGIEAAGTLPTLFDHPLASMEELVTELRKGRCRPLYKEIPKLGSNMLVHEITLGTKGDDELRQRIIVKRPKSPEGWISLKESSEILMYVHNHGFSGGPFRVPTIVDIDNHGRFIIEEGHRGKSLFDLLARVGPEVGREYFKMAAVWLARLHISGIAQGNLQRTAQREHHRFESYFRAFSKSNSPYLEKVKLFTEAVRSFEEEQLSDRAHEFVLVHGDYHPKNIIIGQELMQDIGTLFISVVDFGSAMKFHPAFDVGYFISQFRNQFRGYPSTLEGYPDELFVKTYLEASQQPDSPLFRQALRLFRIRGNLSIASFLVHVGKGTSDDMSAVMAESQALLDQG